MQLTNMCRKQRKKVPHQTLADYKKYIITIIFEYNIEYKNTGNNEGKRLKYKKC
jgi:hypothetical protein